MKRTVLAAVLMLALAAGAGAREPERELIYGAELMTSEEREAYRRQLQGAKTPDAEIQVRQRHRERIQRRAKERGQTLDDKGLLEKKQ